MLLTSYLRSKLAWIDRYYYFVTVFTVGLLVISSGCALAWPSPTVHKIRVGETSIEDRDGDISGIGYVFFIGCIPGLLIVWFFLTFLGSRVGMLAAALLYSISWLIISWANKIAWVYGARLIQGMGQSMTLIIPFVYVVEISPVSWREVAGFSMQFFYNLGLLLQYSIGPYVSFQSLLYVNLALAVLFFVLFSFLATESPYFLLMKKKDSEAETALRQLRKHNEPLNEQEIQKELNDMKVMLEESEQYSLVTKFKILVTEKSNRRALFITLGLTYLFVFSGLSQLLMFAETLFRKAEVNISPSVSCIFIGIVKLIGGFALPFLVKSFGIKTMAVYSTLICSIAMFFLALFYTLKNIGFELKELFWAPLVLLLLYFFLSAIGLSFIMMHVRAEIFPPHLKSTGILIQETCNILLLEICSIFFTQLLHVVYIPFWFFSVSMFLSVIFMIYCLPNSRTMSLYELQQWLNDK